MKIYILGANGMLGSYLHKYFKESVAVTREQIEALVVQNDLFVYQLDSLYIKPDDVVINAIGVINKRVRQPLEFYIVNSIFPRLLADYCDQRLIKLIHVSTDCVFSGKKGHYSEKDLSDDTSVYGMSKSAGEPPNCTVVRASIIGENRNNNQDLLEWVRTHTDSVVTGWTNHIWNGITCLQFAKVCEKIITYKNFWQGVRHVFSPEDISKADLVGVIGQIYGLGNSVEGVDGPSPCDRTLATDYPIMFAIPSLITQIIEQRRFEL